MTRRKIVIVLISMAYVGILYSCVTEEVISTENLSGGQNERSARLDSAQQVKTVKSPKENLFTVPDSTKRKMVKSNG